MTEDHHIRVYDGRAGWLLQLPDESIVVLNRAPHQIEGVLDHCNSDAGGLDLVLYGEELAAEVLDMIERAVAGRVELSESLIAILVQQSQNENLHRCLKMIDTVPRSGVLDLSKAFHRTIPLDGRIAARARYAASRSIRADLVSQVALRPVTVRVIDRASSVSAHFATVDYAEA